MTTRGPLRRQILVPISSNNINKIMALFNKHIANINRTLKKIKSEVIVNSIQADNKDLSITTNKVTSNLNLNIIEKYIKNIDVIDSEDVMTPRLSQSKLYLKILDILYLIKNTNVLITSKVVKKVLQSTYIFNDITLTSKPRIIKTSSKSDMTII